MSADVPGDHLSNERIDAFLRGDLSAAEAEMLERHIETCSTCVDRAASRGADDALLALLRAAKAGSVEETEPAASRYEILGEIGRGGMGVVYRARQSALGRVVALKQIRLGLKGDAIELARFETEALASASLRHPGIVQIHDVGWRQGEPYLAMELVEGGSLAEHLRRGPLPPREAAELVAQVARAVDHAHRAGIVHRDLKPGNILRAADGIPKVADFGLAKRLDAPAGPTRTGSILGTPSYMAPEQAEGGELGPLVDIHALGAVLYECLTGRPPFLAATAIETLDQVRGREPPPPNRLQPGVPRDLQTIALKCLEKDPRRRYPGAAALADDLERFLQGRPIAARPVGPVTRVLKWARRRPSQAALATLGLAMLLGSFLALLAHQSRLKIEIDRANEATRIASAQRSLADANYREAREAIRDVLERIDDPKLAGIPRRGEIQAEQTEAALHFYERVLGAAESPDPAVRLDTAVAAREAANLQIGLNRLEPAEANLNRSIRLLDELTAARPDDAALLREQMTSWVKLGVMLQGRDHARSLESLGRALTLAERVAVIESGSIRSKADLSWCEHNLGSTFLLAGRPADAEPHALRAVKLRRSQLETTPEDIGAKDILAASLINLGLIHDGDDPDRAEACYAEAAGLLEGAVNTRQARLEFHLTLGELLVNWANLAARRGEPDLALARVARGLALIGPIRSAEPNMGRPKRAAMNLHGARANVLGALGRHAEAVADWDRVLEFNDEPDKAFGYRLLRLFALIRGGDHRRASALLDAETKELGDGKTLVGADFYNLACLEALIAGAVAHDPAIPEAKRKDLADASARRAFAWLRRCAGAGFLDDPANRDLAWKDTDLASIRAHSEFSTIVPSPRKPSER